MCEDGLTDWVTVPSAPALTAGAVVVEAWTSVAVDETLADTWPRLWVEGFEGDRKPVAGLPASRLWFDVGPSEAGAVTLRADQINGDTERDLKRSRRRVLGVRPVKAHRPPPPDPEAVADLLAVESLLCQLDEDGRAYLDDWKARRAERRKSRRSSSASFAASRSRPHRASSPFPALERSTHDDRPEDCRLEQRGRLTARRRGARQLAGGTQRLASRASSSRHFRARRRRRGSRSFGRPAQPRASGATYHDKNERRGAREARGALAQRGARGPARRGRRARRRHLRGRASDEARRGVRRAPSSKRVTTASAWENAWIAA